MARFLIFVIAVLGALWAWAWLRLVQPLALPPYALWPLAALFVASFALQLMRWVQRETFERRPALNQFAYAAFGLAILLFFGALAKDASLFLLNLAGYSTGLVGERLAVELTVLLAVGGLLLGRATALGGPRVRRVRVPLPRWPASHLGLKVVQISDLHVGSSIRRPYVEKVVQQVLDLEPDLIVLTGDIGDGNVFELQRDLEPLRRLKAPHGVFYVAGNHEFYWNAGAWAAKMKELGLTVLENQGRWLAEAQLWIGGVPDISAAAMAGMSSEPARAAPAKDMGGPSLLLAHQPKSIYDAAAAGFDLMLSGHTHAGQFFPANLIVRFFNPYHHGLHRHEGRTWVYVNAGTGYWGPKLRLFVPSEITLLRLTPEAGAPA